MKNCFKLWITLLVLTICADAQHKWANFGLIGGFGLSTMYGEDVPQTNWSLTPTGGFSLQINFPVILGFQLDAIYQGRPGSIDETTPDSKKVKTLVTSRYFEVPFMVKISAPVDIEAKPTFHLGISHAWLLTAKSEADTLFLDSVGVFKPKVADPAIPGSAFNKSLLSYVVGAGVEYGLGSVSLRLYWTPSTLDKRPPPEAIDMKNLMVALLVGLRV